MALGWQLLNDDPKTSEVNVNRSQAITTAMSQAFYPLTMPLTVDPGAMSGAVTLGANHAHKLDGLVIQILAAGIGSAIVALSVLLTYRYAAHIADRIGREGHVDHLATLCVHRAQHRRADRVERNQSTLERNWDCRLTVVLIRLLQDESAIFF